MPDADTYINQHIGNYRIIAELNSGTFGTVYQGQHIVFEDDIVAIKLLQAHLRSPQDRTEFIREAQLLKKLTHPNILHIHDAGFHEGIPYIVTEYASRGSLRDRLNQHPGQPLPLAEATTILTQIGQALHYAHQHNIVHRDLKPGNILFNANSEALLADFGIAVVLEKTKRIDIIGTPPYMAPEQFQSELSHKSDQYALGCIAYELLTGRKPFIAPDFYALAFKHLNEYPPAPTQYNPHLPAHIEQAIFKAMIKDRTQRHSDVSAFITALGKTKEQWMEEGEAHLDAKRYEEALAALEQAIRLDPNYAAAYYNKGYALGNLQRHEEALAAFEQAIRLDPNLAAVYYALGNLQRYEEALAAYEQAIRLDPSDAAAYYNKGYALDELKRYEEALAAYEQAIRLDPNLAAAYNNKGAALKELKRYEEALAAYEQAIRLNPNYAKAYYNKGVTLERLGRKKEARQAYDKARQLGYGG